MSNNCKLYNIVKEDDTNKNYYTFSSENNKKLYKNVGYNCANCHNNSFSELMKDAKLIHPYSGTEYNLNVTKYKENNNIYGITCYDDSEAQHNCCGSSGNIDINYNNDSNKFECDSEDLNRNFGRCGFISDLVSGNKCSLVPDTKYKYEYGPVIDKKQECKDILKDLAEDPNSYKNTESSICKRHNIQLVKDLDIIYKPVTHGITEMFASVVPPTINNIFGKDNNATYKKISHEKIYGVKNSLYTCRSFNWYDPLELGGNDKCSEFTLFRPINNKGLVEKTKNLIILSTLIKLDNKTERMFLNCTVPTDGKKSELCLTTADEPLRLLYNFEALIKLDKKYTTRKFANGGHTPVFFSRYDHTNYSGTEESVSRTLNKNIPFVTTNDLDGDGGKKNKAVSSLSTTYTNFKLHSDFVRYDNGLGKKADLAKKNSKLVSLTTDTKNNFILVSSYTETPGGSGKIVLRDHHRNGNDGGGKEGQYFLANTINNTRDSNNLIISFKEYDMDINSYNNVKTTPDIKLKFALNFIISEESNYSNMNKDYGFMPTKKFTDKGFLSLDSKVDNKTIFKYLTQDNTNPATVDPITIEDILNSFPFYQPDLCKYGLSNDATCK